MIRGSFAAFWSCLPLYLTFVYIEVPLRCPAGSGSSNMLGVTHENSFCK